MTVVLKCVYLLFCEINMSQEEAASLYLQELYADLCKKKPYREGEI